MKHWVQIATIGSTLTVGTLAAAQDDVAPRAVVLPPEPPRDQPPEAPPPPRPAVGGEGRWVFDLLGGQIGTGVPFPLGGLGSGNLGVVGIGPLTIATASSVDDGDGMHQTAKSSVISLAPSVDTFVTDRFSIGGRLSAGLTSSSAEQSQLLMQPGYSTAAHGYTLGIAPRIGYAIPLSPSFAFWPRLGAGYEVSRAMVDDADGRTLERVYFVETTLGVGMRVAPHAFFDLGPVLAYRRATSEASPNLGTAYGVPGGSGRYEAFGASFRASLRVDF